MNKIMELVKSSSVPVSALLVAFLYSTAEAAVTEWTNPVITGAASGSGVATPSIAENTPTGSTGVAIAATAGGAKTYAILSQPTAGKLTIHTSTGVLSLAAGNSFDFETEPTYILQITCEDAGDSTTGTAIVTLSITNVNEAPMFESFLYTAVIADGATAGTLVGNVSATDEDASSTLTYLLTGGNTNTAFAIGVSTGVITVAAGKTMSKAKTAGYELEVTVSDGSLTETTTVLVVVSSCGSGTAVVMASVITVFVAMIAHKL